MMLIQIYFLKFNDLSSKFITFSLKLFANECFFYDVNAKQKFPQ